MTVKMTPETYSGVAVVAIEATDSVRSVRVPSRMPARMPISSAIGTIVTITQNISLPVAASAGKSLFDDRRLELGRAAEIALQYAAVMGLGRLVAVAEARDRLAGRRIDVRLLLHDAQPLAVAHEEILPVAVLRQPALDMLVRRAHVELADRQLAQVRLEIDHEEHDHRQAQHGENHGPETPQNECKHVRPLPAGLGSDAFSFHLSGEGQTPLSVAEAIKPRRARPCRTHARMSGASRGSSPPASSCCRACASKAG